MFGRRLRRWVILTVAAPLIGKGLQRVAASVREHEGDAKTAERLDRVGEFLQKRSRRRRRW